MGRSRCASRTSSTPVFLLILVASLVQRSFAAATENLWQEADRLKRYAARRTSATDTSAAESDVTLELAEMVSRLQAQVSQLQEQRAEDRALLKLLQDERNTAGEPRSGRPVDEDVIRRFDAQLTSLQTDLKALVSAKERETERLSDVRELRFEFDGVHSECQKLRMDVQGLRDRREEDVKLFGQQRNSQVTIKWLQKTVQELRQEMKELAAVQNVTAALGRQQQFETGLSLLRSDVVALRTQLEECRVAQDKDTATLIQMQQDVQDLHSQHHQMAANAQLFREELSQFKDELFAASGTSRVNGDDGGRRSEEVRSRAVFGTQTATGDEEWSKKKKLAKKHAKSSATHSDLSSSNNVLMDMDNFFSPTTHHRIRHHGHVRKEVEEIKEVLSALRTRQLNTEKQLTELRQNHSVVDGNMRHVWGRMGDLLNDTRSKAAQHASLERSMGELRSQVKQLDRVVADNVKTLRNLSESMTGIDKLHSSTVQLFEALEGLEDDYGQRIGDLHKEVSKFEFNIAQLSSNMNIIKEDQSNYYDALRVVRTDVSALQQESEKNAYTLASLKSDILHEEAQHLLLGVTERTNLGGASRGRDTPPDVALHSAVLELESRMAQLETRVTQNGRLINETVDRLAHKADLEHVTHWAESADQLDEKIANLSRKMEPVNERVDRLEKEMRNIYHQFPNDCSQMTVKKTGVYSIYPPDSERSTLVLCDTGSGEDDGGWTVVQQRQEGSREEFNRNWTDYKEGFGQVSEHTDFWVGNEILHRLTSQRNEGASDKTTMQLRFDLWDDNGRYYFAQYDSVIVEDEQHAYRLRLGPDYFGNASDAMRYHDGMKFSTRDVDNDVSSLQCAHQYEGGWWYNHCQHVNINGKYTIGLTWYNANDNTWVQLKRVQMKIRPVPAQTFYDFYS